MRSLLEYLLLTASRGVASRFRLVVYRSLGMRAGVHNRIEGLGRVRRCSQIEIGSYNTFTQGCWLWPNDENYEDVRIRIGNRNYFNRNLMIDACGLVEIGSHNMFGPDIYITDSNHAFGPGLKPNEQPMHVGRVKIGSCCWIGAKVVILKDVELGDGCVVGAGAVVTRSVSPGTVVAGVPAQRLPQRVTQSLSK